MEGPVFNQKMSVNEFKKQYWYKTELEKICRAHNLPTYGTKYELSHYIIQFLNGVSAQQIKPIRKKNRRGLFTDQIRPETKILESGFSLNKAARLFFGNYYGVEKFSFTKTMAIKMREVEAKCDKEATVQDLIDAYEQKRPDLTNNNEEQTYQWNHFVRDFRNDSLAQKYRSPMKVAAFLWGKIKSSEQEKKYSRALLLSYQDEIIEYLNNEEGK